jgi:hypothetical protein
LASSFFFFSWDWLGGLIIDNKRPRKMSPGARFTARSSARDERCWLVLLRQRGRKGTKEGRDEGRKGRRKETTTMIIMPMPMMMMVLLLALFFLLLLLLPSHNTSPFSSLQSLLL